MGNALMTVGTLFSYRNLLNERTLGLAFPRGEKMNRALRTGDLIAWVDNENGNCAAENIIFIGLVLSGTRIYWGSRVLGSGDIYDPEVSGPLLCDYGLLGIKSLHLESDWILLEKGEK